MANTVDIILKGTDQASGTIGNVNKSLDGLDTKAGTVTSKFANLGKMAAGLGLAGLAVSAGKAVIDLGQMGEESAQLDAKFTALAGGTARAADLFTAMDAATGKWLTRDEKMEAGTRIMQLGLAGSAEEAGELARTAILLGDSTQTASQRIDSLTQMLATGQTRGLANFGISIIAVRERVDDLKGANEEMTSEMATQQAILEATAGKVALLGDYMPVTATQEMANATADLKDSLGDIVAEPYIVSVKFLTEGIENVISLLNRTSNDPTQQLQGIDKQIENAKAELESMKSATGKGILGGLFNQQYSPEQLAAAQARIDELIAKQQYLKGVTSETGDVGVASLDRQSASAVLLKDNLQAVEDKLLAAEDAAKGKGTEEADLDPVQAQLEKLRKKAEATRVNEEAMRLFRQETEGATGAVNSLNEAKAKDPLSDKKRTKIDAAGAVSDLQKGLFGPEVIGAIDVDKLAAEPGMAGLARKSFEAFGKALEANKGGVNIAESLIGFQKDDKGVSPADTAAEKAVNTLSAAIGTQVTGKDFAGKMIGYGETIWGYTEEGMINKAKGSTAFQSAINAMVSAAIAGALQ